jgi:fatty acid CoA ligase FadD36
VRGRSKDTIKTAGFSVHADDIEETLAQHPHIQEVAVVGRPHARLGEVPIAFVTTDVESLSASEICRWVNGRLNDRQRVYSVYILERLPVNASGKVVKAALQACTQD